MGVNDAGEDEINITREYQSRNGKPIFVGMPSINSVIDGIETNYNAGLSVN